MLYEYAREWNSVERTNLHNWPCLWLRWRLMMFANENFTWTWLDHRAYAKGEFSHYLLPMSCNGMEKLNCVWEQLVLPHQAPSFWHWQRLVLASHSLESRKPGIRDSRTFPPNKEQLTRGRPISCSQAAVEHPNDFACCYSDQQSTETSVTIN